MQTTHNGTVVAKFGGSSLADAAQFRKVKAIVRANPHRRFVIPSAPGKRHARDTKITDMLYDCFDEAAKIGDCNKTFAAIEERFNGIISELGLKLDLSKSFAATKSAINRGAGKDFAASRGEYYCGKVLAAFLDFDFLDPAEVIFFDARGRFDSEKTNYVLGDRLTDMTNAVIPGFYGSLSDGSVKTFSRGGSDITGSIVARAANADLYENWTDVSGFLMADPRIISNPLTIQEITYRELRELSYMGATVLHEDAVFPVRAAGIPINIRNTNAPEGAGTLILPSTENMDMRHVITGIAGKKGFSIITIEKAMMNSEIGFGRRVLSVLEKYKISFEHMPSGIDSLCVIVGEKEISGHEADLIHDLEEAAAADSVKIENDLALIAVVGRAMKSAVGTAAKVFKCLANEGINIRMIDQGSSELNIILGVDSPHFELAIRTIYAHFVK